MGGVVPELSMQFLNSDVPLWFALLMAFTSPYMWSKYVKKGVRRAFDHHFGGGE